MDIFSKRPLFISCMLFLFCSVLGYFISKQVKIILILLSAAALFFSLILAAIRYYSAKKKNTFLVMILSFMMIVLAFISSYNFFNVEYDKREEYYNKETTIEAVVTSVDYINNFSSSYKITVNKINGNIDKHKAILECSYPAALEIGDQISVSCLATEPTDSGGRYDERTSALSKSIFVIYTSQEPSELAIVEYVNKKTEGLFFSKLNNKLSNILISNIGGEAGNLSSALLLGNRDLLSDSVVRDFRRVGASHILALSGMHMSLLMGALMLILKIFIGKGTPIAIILSVLSVFYLALTGFSISATRSVLMLLIVYLSVLMSAIPDSLTSLSISGFLIILFSPGAVLDAAFWMSFASTLGILVYMLPVKEFFDSWKLKYDNKLKRFYCKIVFSILTAITTSLAALLPLIIVMCIFIKELSILSILSSVVLSIPTAIIIILSLFLLPLYSIPFVSSALVSVIRSMSDFMIDFCSYFSDLENAVISLNYPFATFMAILLGAALLFSFSCKRFNPFLSLVPFALCLTVCAGMMFVYENKNKDQLKVSYINVSSNSDIIVLSNEREAVICDISNGSKTSYQYALDEISEVRATEIKAILLTRYTYSHNATLHSFFQNNKVRELWIPYPQNQDELNKMEILREFAINNDVTVYVYNYGDTLMAFDHAYIEHTCEYIERSTVPIDLIGIYTGREHLTYVSPAFNESELKENAEYHFSKSRYVIFGNRGPKTHIPYNIPNGEKIKAIAFADEIRAGYYIPPEYSFTAYYMVSKGSEMEYYLDE